MSLGYSLWMAGICGVYMSILRIFYYYDYSDLYFVSIMIGVGLSVYFYDRLSKNLKYLGLIFLIIPVIYLTGIIPGTELIAGSKNYPDMNWIGKLIPVLPPVLYTIYRMFTESIRKEYWKLCIIFKVVSAVVLADILVTLSVRCSVKDLIPYLIFYALAMVMSLNIVRMGGLADWKCKSLFAGIFLLYSSISAAVGFIVYGIIKHFGTLIEWICTPFAMLLGWIVSLAVDSYSKVLDLEEVKKIEEEASKNDVLVDRLTENGDVPISQSTDINYFVVSVFVLFAVVFVIYVIYKLIKTYKYYHEKSDFIEDDINDGTIEQINIKRSKKKWLFKGNREKIRKYYAKHMQHVSVAGYFISRSSTSLDISEKGRELLKKEDNVEDRIREIYMKARYSNETINYEEVKEMKELSK